MEKLLCAYFIQNTSVFCTDLHINTGHSHLLDMTGGSSGQIKPNDFFEKCRFPALCHPSGEASSFCVWAAAEGGERGAGRKDTLRCCVTWCPDTQPSTPCHREHQPAHHHGHQQQVRVHLLHAAGLRGSVQ